MGFVWFACGFDDYTYQRREENPENVRALLSEAHAILDARHASFAPIQAEKIRETAPTLSSADAFIDHVATLKLGELCARLHGFVTYEMPTDEAVLKKIGNPDELAVCAYLHFAFRSVFPRSLPAKTPYDKKEVRLAADLDGWTVVKKINLQAAERKEVFFALCSMRSVAEKKATGFQPGFDAFNDALQSALSGFPERKSFGKLGLVLKAVKDFTAQNPEFQEYALSLAMARVGFPPYLTNDHVASLYPELKIPKPKGNFGKKKK